MECIMDRTKRRSFSASIQIISSDLLSLCVFHGPFMRTYEIGYSSCNEIYAYIRCFQSNSPRISLIQVFKRALRHLRDDSLKPKHFLWFLVIMSWRFFSDIHEFLCTFFTVSGVTCKVRSSNVSALCRRQIRVKNEKLLASCENAEYFRIKIPLARPSWCN